MSWFERLTSLDCTFLNLEDRTAHMHVAGLAVFDGALPPYERVLRLIESRLERVPRYRQRLQFVPPEPGPAGVVPLAARQTVGIALLSYNGSIGVGLLGDADQARDLADLGGFLAASLRELMERAQVTARAS